jgi:ACS family glucarate transporter-like MFS transporter
MTSRDFGVHRSQFTIRSNSHRWWIVFLLFVASLINYLDRATISMALPLLSRELSLGPETKGLLLSTFFVSYAAMQVPIGWCADRFNLRWLYAGAFTLWSLAQGLTGLATGLGTLMACRIALGVGESIYLPGGTKIVSLLFSHEERGLPSGLFDFGTRSGLVLEGLLIPWLLVHYGWRRTFLVVGLAALAWLVPWILVTPKRLRGIKPRESAQLLMNGFTPKHKSHPSTALSPSGEHKSHPPTSLSPSGERVAIPQPRESRVRGSDEPFSSGRLATATPLQRWGVRILRALAPLKNRNLLGICLGFFCFDYYWYLLVTWLPDYLVTVRHLTILRAGIFTALPFFVFGVRETIGGWIADQLIKVGWNETRTRKGIVTVAFLTGLLLIPASRVETATAAIALVMGGSLVGFATGNLIVILQSCAPPDQVGEWTGWENFAGNVGGVVAPLATGFLIARTGSYAPGFALAAFVLLAGLLSNWFVVGELK